MPRENVTITGVGNVLKAFGDKKKDMEFKIHEALGRCAAVVYRKSQKLVPRDTEALAHSGRVETNDKKGKGAQFEVVYGDEEAFYALYVHEDLTKKHAPPTQAKFLEDAVRLTRGTCASIIAYAVSETPRYTKNGVDVE